jgi:catalase
MSATTLSRGDICILRVVAALSMALTASPGNAAEVAPTIFETVPPDEAQQTDRLAAIIVELQVKREKQDTVHGGRPLRGVHPKSHGCVRADFTVNSDLAEEDRVGLLAYPGRTYQAWIRFSNAAALPEPDVKVGPDNQIVHGSRGMALKVLDVEGEMLDLDGGRHNQDFLMINTPMFAFPDARNYLRLNEVLLKSDTAGDPTEFFKTAAKNPRPPANDPEWGNVWADFTIADGESTQKSGRIIKQEIGMKTVRNPLQVPYFGAAPFLFGPDQAMKVSAKPCREIKQAEFTNVTATEPDKDYLQAALTETMRGNEAMCFDFKIQVRSKDELKEPGLIEDATELWGENEVDYYRSVARINIPAPQSPDSLEAKEQCERLAFTPWHSLAAHQPIGGINRLRQKVYQNSAQHRGADGN